jgi:hypothetical protein
MNDSEEVLLRYGQRLALQAAAKEAARPKPIIVAVADDAPQQPVLEHDARRRRVLH